MVIGWKYLLATLNQRKENAQKIMASTTAPYDFMLLFNSVF
jgi:hypothetical protein